MSDGYFDDIAPFESARTLIASGKEAIPDFEARCKAVVDATKHDIVSSVDPKTQDKIFKFRFRERMPPRLRKHAGDIISDLRHSLDHAIGDAAVLLGRPDAKGIHFPLSKSASELQGQIKRVCRNIDPSLYTFIEAQRPYLGGDDLLYLVCQLANSHKHQRVIRLGVVSDLVLRAGGNTRISGGFAFGDFGWNALRNELTFARVAAKATMTGDLKDNIASTFQVMLGEGEPPLSGPAASVLGAFAGEVERIVLSLEAETRRILDSRR